MIRLYTYILNTYGKGSYIVTVRAGLAVSGLYSVVDAGYGSIMKFSYANSPAETLELYDRKWKRNVTQYVAYDIDTSQYYT